MMFAKPLKDLISLESEVDDVSLISIDSKGTDIRVRQGAQVCRNVLRNQVVVEKLLGWVMGQDRHG